MSREIEIELNRFRHDRINGIKLMRQKRIRPEDYQDCMRMHEEKLRAAGVTL